VTGACDGRVALVTGASRGIGAAISLGLAREGAAVAVTARTLDAHPRLPGSLREVADGIDALGAKAVPIPADLSDTDDRARIVPEVEAALGPIDILVNNAAAAFYVPTAELPLRRRRLLFEVNVHAPVDLAQQVVPGMRSRGRGWIVNISSATSRRPKGPPFDSAMRLGATSTLYGSTKAALERITTGLAAEVYDDGVAVNSLAPVAAVRTPGAEAHLGPLLDERPDIVEPVDLIVEAALALATCDPATTTGRVVHSRPFLTELGRIADAAVSAESPER
jgi:NAD(P)-dependent dehydrogenase (short-subunit alcohol dehydrogenase family)